MKCYTNKFNSLNTNRLGNHTSASNKLIMISINKLCDRFKKINLFYHCYSNKSIALPNPHSSYRSKESSRVEGRFRNSGKKNNYRVIISDASSIIHHRLNGIIDARRFHEINLFVRRTFTKHQQCASLRTKRN